MLGWVPSGSRRIGAGARTIRDAGGMTRRGGTACVVGICGQDDQVCFSALELFHVAAPWSARLGSAGDRKGWPGGHRGGVAEMTAGQGVRTLIEPQVL